MQKCIRMGITIFKFFIWGGISSDMHSETRFTAPLPRRRKTIFPTVTCNFGRGHYEEYSCEFVLNLDQWFRRRCPLIKKLMDRKCTMDA